jgi:uncharacterized protein
MIPRLMKDALLKAAEGFPVITITGPRQSGKTTLSRLTFPDYRYINLENPEELRKAESDPRSLFKNLEQGLIIDEIQKYPELLSWIQVFADETKLIGKIILTGSNQFEYLRDMSQTLAGRNAIFKLLPFSIAEIRNQTTPSWEASAARGFYPRLYDQTSIDTEVFYGSYINTYLERDIRSAIQKSNLRDFTKFMGLCAGRTGQLLNASSLATECGVDVKTIQHWISHLEENFIVYLLKPYHSNISKRLVKSPKLYFIDTGLVCNLLSIRNESDLMNHPLRGAIFETMMVSDIMKYFLNQGHQAPIFFYRDSSNHEVDIVLNIGGKIIPIEIKSGSTIQESYFSNIKYIRKILNLTTLGGVLFGDDREEQEKDILIKGWRYVGEMMASIKN